MLKSSKILIFFILMIGAVEASFAEVVPISTFIDGVNVGYLTLSINKLGKAESMKGSELIEMLSPYIQADKIIRISNLIEAESILSFENLNRVGIGTSYNDIELKLILTIPLEMRSVKDFPVLILGNKTGLSLYEKYYSGYLNLRGLLRYSTQTSPVLDISQKDPINAQLELVQNLKYFTLESTANYIEFDEGGPIKRRDTSIVHDFENQKIRLRLGDFNSEVQSFQTSLGANGLQIKKQFGINQNKDSINKRSTLIQIKNNSLLEVFINNNLVVRSRVGPGPYNLKELPLLYGQNKVKIIIHDDFGGVEEFEVNLLYDDQILAKGVSDFAYQLGKPSYFVGNEKKYYNDNFSSFYHKYGLTDEETIFINHQSYLSTNLFGLGVGTLTRFGTNYFDLAQFNDGNILSGNAARWQYSSPDLNANYLNQFRLFGGAELRSKNFSNISTTTASLSTFSEKYDFSFQKQLTERSSMSLGFTRIVGQNLGSDDLIRRLYYQSRLFSNWRMDLSYNWSQQESYLGNTDQILLTLNWTEPEGKAHAAFTHSTVDNNSSVRVDRNSNSNFNDVTLNMYASRQQPKSNTNDSQNLDVSANYNAAKYVARLGATALSSSSTMYTSGQFGFGTALAWTTEGVSFSNPITDSFALISTEGMKKGQYIVVPNGSEKDNLLLKNNENFVFSNLGSYADRPLKLDSTGLGASNHLDREAYILTTKYRSGLFVPLKVNKTLLVRGRLASADLEQVKYAYGKILTEDGKVFSNNFFTDETGNFLIDGLSYGKYRIELSNTKIETISFELIESAETIKAKESGEAEDTDSSEYEMGTIKIEKKAGT